MHKHTHTHTTYMYTLHTYYIPNVCVHVRIVQLALKHRQNKNQKMRIVVFIGSPMEAEEKEVGVTIIQCTKVIHVHLDSRFYRYHPRPQTNLVSVFLHVVLETIYMLDEVWGETWLFLLGFGYCHPGSS